MSPYPFSRAIATLVATEYPMAGGLISNRLASSLTGMPNSFTAQKQERLLDLTLGKRPQPAYGRELDPASDSRRTVRAAKAENGMAPSPP
jgi:hypothetical protein